MKRFLSGCVLVSGLILSGCTPLGLAAGAGASLTIASSQEGGVRTALTDNAIQLKIADKWLKSNFKLYSKVSSTVKEGRVLVTGSVPNPDMRVEAVRLVWQVDGVRQVLNEIMVEEKEPGVTSFVKDAWITGNLKTRMMLDKHIQSINYNIDTARGNIYLMGVAQDRKELDLVINYARNTKNVKHVVNYVRLRYENPEEIGRAVSDR